MKWIVMPVIWLLIGGGYVFVEVVAYLYQAIWRFDFNFKSAIDYECVWRENLCGGWHHWNRGPIHFVRMFGNNSHGKGSQY